MHLTEQGVEAIVIPLYEEFGDECIDAVGKIVEGIEFEPGDFEGCVVLTLEEAKKLYLDLFTLADMQPIPIERFYAWQKLKDQIEEQEKSHEA